MSYKDSRIHSVLMIITSIFSLDMLHFDEFLESKSVFQVSLIHQKKLKHIFRCTLSSP